MLENVSYITVAIALPVYRTYTYSIPEHFLSFVQPGKRVLVPFGRRRVTGYILNFCEKPKKFKSKHILDVLDEISLFPPSMIPFFQWIANYYIYPVGEVIKTALPGGINVYDINTASITGKGEKFILQSKPHPIETPVLQSLKEKSCPVKNIGKNVGLNISNALIYSLEKRGLLKISKELKNWKKSQKMEKYVSIADDYLLDGKFPDKNKPDRNKPDRNKSDRNESDRNESDRNESDRSKSDTNKTGKKKPDKKISAKRQAILDMVKEHKELSLTQLKKSFPSALRLVKLLEEAGYVSIIEKKIYRDPFGDIIEPDFSPILSNEQASVVNDVLSSLGKGYKNWLLAGVTGSGKTEVYMHIAMEAIKRGFTALVLVPEISLISQTARRFRARFGDKIAVLHSGLTHGQWYDQWMRITKADVDIVIGARSAIFAPIKNIGIIIIDEEHDTSYKQDHGLHYNARDIATVRAKQAGCICLFGSGTPSVQSYFNALSGKFSLVELKNRVNLQVMPKISIIDLKNNSNQRGINRYITPELSEKIKITLNRGEQALLFLNRRGFANFPVCAKCGESVKCKYCDVTLTLHKKINAYQCHFCGFSIPSSSHCLSCNCGDIISLGMGTEKVEEAVIKLFPTARVARLDYDTTKKKGSMLKILKGVRQRKIDILVGTQMVAKGHDFPNITLVGIICADLSLNFPDFRAGERTFQLLAQVAGRAGRGESPGQVIMQTYNPKHFSIVAAQNHDFTDFYSREVIFRQSLYYPPFSRIIQLKISGTSEQETKWHALSVGNKCNDILQYDNFFKNNIIVLGPIEATIARVANHFRWQILLKSKNSSVLHTFVKKLLFDGETKISNKNVKIIIDVDPFFMM